MAHLLSVQGLVTTFRNEGKEFNAIEGVNLHVDRGEIVGIVGESGSGKSVTMLSVLQLIASPGRVAGGEVYLEGVEGNLLSYGKESETMRQVRGGIYIHALKNALLPVITLMGLRMGGMLGGSVFVENVFVIPGMGSLLVNAISMQDIPLIQGCVLLIALFTSVVNLITDIIYVLVDPRIKIA